MGVIEDLMRSITDPLPSQRRRYNLPRVTFNGEVGRDTGDLARSIGKPGAPTRAQFLASGLLTALGAARTGPPGLPPLRQPFGSYVNTAGREVIPARPVGPQRTIAEQLEGIPPNEGGFNLYNPPAGNQPRVDLWRNQDLALLLRNRPDTPDLKSGGRWLSNTISPEQRREIVGLYNDVRNPMSVNDLATRYQIDRTSIRRILEQEGMLAPTGVSRRANLDEFMYLRTSGMSPQDAARQIGVPLRDINRYINFRANRLKGPEEGTPISVDSVVRALRDMEGVYATQRPAGRGTFLVDFYGNEGRNRQMRLPLDAPRPAPENRLMVRHGHRPDAVLGELEGGRATRFDTLEALVSEIRGRTGRSPIPAPPTLPANQPIVNINPNQLELPLENIVRRHHSRR
jgi:hypothetical protein